MRANPNRMEMMRLGRRLSLARRGHRLLKDKQDELMEKFTETVKEVRKLRRELEELYSGLRGPFMASFYNSTAAGFDSCIRRPPLLPKFKGGETRLMNLRIPEIQVEFEDRSSSLGSSSVAAAMPVFLEKFREAALTAVELSNAERRMYMIAEELQKVRRRVNALEHIFIPRLEETINYISMQLEEMERENITRLMKIKDIVRKNR